MVTHILKKNFSLILLSLLPCAFVIGPFIVELIVNILIILFLSDLFKKKFDFFKEKIVIFFFFLYIFIILSFKFRVYTETILNIFFILDFFISFCSI